MEKEPMEIVKSYPPNIDLIRTVFPVNKDTVYAYGDVIYSPQGEDLRADLIYHEHVHRGQQELAGGPELWWNRYLTDIDFRLNQEVEAYYEQWQWIKKHLGSKIGKMALLDIAQQLASPLYQFDLDKYQAETMLRKYGKTN